MRIICGGKLKVDLIVMECEQETVSRGESLSCCNMIYSALVSLEAVL